MLSDTDMDESAWGLSHDGHNYVLYDDGDRIEITVSSDEDMEGEHSLTELRNVSFSPYSSSEAGWGPSGVHSAPNNQAVTCGNGATAMEPISLLSPNSDVYHQNNCASQHGTGLSVTDSLPVLESVSPPSVSSAPFPLLLQSADGSFVRVLYNQTFNNSLYPMSWGVGSAPVQPTLSASTALYVQQSGQILAPSVLQGQQPGPKSHSHNLVPGVLSGLTSEESSRTYSRNTLPKARTKKRKAPATGASGQSPGQLQSGNGGQGAPLCRKTQPKSKSKKFNSAEDRSGHPHNKKETNSSRRVLTDVNAIGPSRQADVLEKGGKSKLAKSAKAAASSVKTILGGLKQKKTRHIPRSPQGSLQKKRKPSYKPAHYYPQWPALELDMEDEDSSSMAAFFKSIRSRRGDKRRFTSKELVRERAKEIAEKLRAGCEEGLKVVNVNGKGRGVVAGRVFEKDEFVVEYAGEVINITTANQREDLYERDERVGCYMYYFSHTNKHYCIDATMESGKLGRLLNHSRKGNCYTKVVVLGGAPRLVLLASQRIEEGQELTYDYGDRSMSAVENHPWLRS